MSETRPPLLCRGCGAPALVEVAGFGALRRVSSDCRPFGANGSVSTCAHCGLVQKAATAEWHRECEEIYAGYALYAQSATGTEQKYFTPDGVGRPRSEYTLASIAEAIGLGEEGRMLDVGSGTGAVLRAFHKVRARWRMTAVEPHPRDLAALGAIPGVDAVATTTLDRVSGQFDLVTFFHVLEHVPDLVPFLAQVRARVATGGYAAIQVPNFERNPFDLVIADHANHFTPATIEAVLCASGFELVRLDTTTIPKELTVVCRPDGRAPSARPDLPGQQTLTRASDAVRWLGAANDAAARIAREVGAVGVFGSSIAAAWLAANLGDRVRFFVDEDAARAGTTYLGRPILSPGQVHAASTVLVCAPGAAAASIARRLDGPQVRYVAVEAGG